MRGIEAKAKCLSGSPPDAATWGARVQSGAGESTDDDGPTARLMRQILDAFSEYERALIRARVRAAMAAAKVRGAA